MNTNIKTLKDKIEAVEQMLLTVPANERNLIAGVLFGMELAEQIAKVEHSTKTEQEREVFDMVDMFPQNLKTARKLRGYTMEELANAYNHKLGGGLSKGTLSKYENGKQEPMMKTVVNLAEILGVSIDFLVGKDVAETYKSITNELRKIEKVLILYQSFLESIDRKKYEVKE